MQDLALVTDFLRSVAPFDSLDEESLQRSAAAFEASYHPRGAELFASGADVGLALIRKGAVRLQDAQGRLVDKRSEGELFGHRLGPPGAAGDYRAETEEDTLLWWLPDTAFAALCERHPAFAAYFESPPGERLQSAIQRAVPATRLADLMTRPAVCLSAGAAAADAAALMSREGVSCVLVTREGGLAGIVTDRDLRQRVLAAGRGGTTPLTEVMTPDPVVARPDAEVDEALLLLMQRHCHHLPVVADGRPVGVVTAGDLLRAQSEHPLRLVRDIQRQNGLEDLCVLRSRLPSLLLQIADSGCDARHAGRLTTRVADAFTGRLLELAEAELGPPPMPYAWLAFGSQAREECSAGSDQDNGLLLERQPDAAESDYFAALGSRVCDALDRLGYAHCPGDIMARNPRWRVPLQQWKAYFDGWIDEPEPTAVMHCSIFFDLRCIHGKPGLADALREYAVRRARDNGIFLRFLAANVLSHRPPLGFFRRLVQEHDGSHSEGLNLKHRGIVPITDLARLRALEAGVSEPGTYRRLERAVAAGSMNADDAASLRDALLLVGKLRLGWQAQQLRRGEPPGNLVPPEEFSPLVRRHLKAAFGIVVEAQRALASRYPGV